MFFRKEKKQKEKKAEAIFVVKNLERITISIAFAALNSTRFGVIPLCVAYFKPPPKKLS